MTRPDSARIDTGRTDTVGRLAVTWRPDAEPGDAGRARLAALGRRLVEGALDDAFDGAPGVEVCVRRIALPAHRMRWTASDDELVAGWAVALCRAVAAAICSGGPDVVRYPSPGHARRELVTAVLAGNRERKWAWRMLGLWPPAGSPPDRDVLRAAVAGTAATAPEEAVGLLVAVCAAGTLLRLVAAVGEETVMALVAAAWRAARGDPAVLRPGRALPGAPPTAEHDPAAPTRSAADDPAPVPAAEPVAYPVPPDPAAARLAVHVRARSVVAAGAPSVVTGPDGTSRPLAVALAAAALLEVEPAAAAGPAAAAVVAALAAPAAPPVPAAAAGRDAVAAATARAGDPDPGLPDPTVPPGDPSAPSGRPDAAAAAPGSAARPPARTAWGGLLFLLPLAAEVDLPARAAADPDRYGPALRTVLHALARLLVARAVPDAGPAEPDDPAVLAFAGLAPTAEPPREPVDLADPALLDAEADLLVATLRERLVPAPLAEADERALLVAVARRRAVVEADPAWIDVLLELDEVSVDVRRAGLDLDPGFLPWLGCVVRYRYG